MRKTDLMGQFIPSLLFRDSWSRLPSKKLELSPSDSGDSAWPPSDQMWRQGEWGSQRIDQDFSGEASPSVPSHRPSTA
ncbi:hypothetical protein LEMLEM_LOCUS16664 [Lemmus lemmus]